MIEEPIVRILFHGEIAAEIPATALAENTPIYHRELLQEPPEYAKKLGSGRRILFLPVTPKELCTMVHKNLGMRFYCNC